MDYINVYFTHVEQEPYGISNFFDELECEHFIDLVKSDPVTCTHYYDHQMATFCNLLKKDSSIFGKVDDFFFVTKF